MFGVKFDDATLVVDNAIGLVRKIETITKGDDRRLFWLHKRGEDGFFPEKVFRIDARSVMRDDGTALLHASTVRLRVASDACFIPQGPINYP